MATNVTALCCSACGQPMKARRAARAAGITVARTAAEILAPVGRRKLGRDRVHVVVECVFARDGQVDEVMRLTVGRSPRDTDALAIEAGRRMAILFRARAVNAGWSGRAWYRIGDKWVLSWCAEMIERAAAQLVDARIAPADTLYADAAE